jgi:hypothetical protein
MSEQFKETISKLPLFLERYRRANFRALPFMVRYLSRNSVLELGKAMAYATSTIHEEDVKQCRWTAIGFLLNTLPRHRGAYFAHHERQTGSGILS